MNNPAVKIPTPYDDATVSTFVVQDKGFCVFCRQQHPPWKCTKVTSIIARRAILRKYARCFVCLRNGHIARDCKSDYKCNKCTKKHHISICDAEERKVEKTSNNFANNKNNVMLQTAVGQIYDVNSERFVMSRLLFDTGSQRTYITDSLRRRLKLKAVRRENIIIQTFNSTESELREVEIVQIRVNRKDHSGFVYVEAICVPEICSPLRNQQVKTVVDNHKHLQNLKLAEFCENSNELAVDVLIGCDFYFSFVSGVVKKGETGPSAVETCLGWVLCGTCQTEFKEKTTFVQLNTTHVLRINSNETIENELRVTWRNFGTSTIQEQMMKLKYCQLFKTK